MQPISLQESQIALQRLAHPFQLIINQKRKEKSERELLKFKQMGSKYGHC